MLVGYPEYADARDLQRRGADPRRRRAARNHRKQALPNYKVFDEKRYFAPGRAADGRRARRRALGLLVCEDIWEAGACRAARAPRAPSCSS